MFNQKTIWFLFVLLALCVSCDQAANTTQDNGPVEVVESEPEPTETTPPPTAVPEGIWVDTTEDLGPISPLVYGTNYGPWMAVTVENQPAFEASGLKYIRFPGGRWGDSHNLRDYQVRQLMVYAEQLDAEVTVSARLLEGSPEQAADLVKMVNEDMGHDIEWWSIGNEPSLYATMQNSPDWDTVHFNEQWRLYADAMLEADPNIKLMGPNTHQFRQDESTNPKDANGLDWMREFLRENGDMVDVVTFHRYPFPDSMMDPLPTVDMLRDNSPEWDEIIPKIREVIMEETGRDIPIGVMEINSNWSDVSGGDATPDSHYNAIWWGDVLTRLIKQDVYMVTHFALQSKSAGWAMLGRTTVRPTYYTYQLFHQLGEDRVFVHSDDEMINILAAKRDDGALTVLMINRADDPISHPFSVDGESQMEADERWVLDLEHNAENTGNSSIDGSIELPGQSMTLLVFK
ncbi:MAG: hypothetical protein AAGD96_14830 [Chloroflexota bacterium]